MKERSGVALDDARGRVLPCLTARDLERDRRFFVGCYIIIAVAMTVWLTAGIWIVATIFSLW